MTFSPACLGRNALGLCYAYACAVCLIVCSAGEYATISYFHHHRRRRHRMCVHVPAHLALIACYLLRWTPVFLTRKDTLLTPRPQPKRTWTNPLSFPVTHTHTHTHTYALPHYDLDCPFCPLSQTFTWHYFYFCTKHTASHLGKSCSFCWLFLSQVRSLYSPVHGKAVRGAAKF